MTAATGSAAGEAAPEATGPRGILRRGVITGDPRRLLRDTPGRLTLAMLALLLLIATSAGAAVADTSTRLTTIDDSADQRGRMAIAAFEMYRAMSDADSAVTSTFLPGRSSKPELGNEYSQGISRASTAVTTLSREAASQGQATTVAELAATLPVYTSLVETARTYHRQGEPLGLSYLQNASALAREEMLPQLRELQSSAMRELDGAHDDATAFPWVAAGAMLVTLGGMVYAQIRLSRHTNRVFNIGTATGTVIMLVAFGWLLVSWWGASGHMNNGHEDGAEPLRVLSQAHLDAQGARGDEALTLIAQGGGTDYEAEFDTLMGQLIGDDGGLTTAEEMFDDPELSDRVDRAAQAAAEWKEQHAQLREADDKGDFDAAVASATGTEKGTAGAAYIALNDALTEANAQAAEEFTGQTTAAASALRGAGVGLAVLCVTAMITTAAGWQQRISEYR